MTQLDQIIVTQLQCTAPYPQNLRSLSWNLSKAQTQRRSLLERIWRFHLPWLGSTRVAGLRWLGSLLRPPTSQFHQPTCFWNFQLRRGTCLASDLLRMETRKNLEFLFGAIRNLIVCHSMMKFGLTFLLGPHNKTEFSNYCLSSVQVFLISLSWFSLFVSMK